MRTLLSQDTSLQVRLERAIEEISALDKYQLPPDLQGIYDEFIVKANRYWSSDRDNPGLREDLARAALNLYKEFIVCMMIYV